MLNQSNQSNQSNQITQSRQFDLIIKDGTCALTNEDGSLQFVQTSIGIKDGKIIEIGPGLEKRNSALKIISAEQLHVLPGVIDTQVHFRDPGLTHKEDLASGTLAAIAGGVTSVLEMPNTRPATTTKELFLQKCELTHGRISCNVGFFIGATEKNKDELKHLELLPGCCGIKIFMGSSTGDLLLSNDSIILEILESTKGPVAVHAEDEDLLKEMKEKHAGCTDVREHSNIRDEKVALKATKRIVALAEKAQHSVHILHVSSQEEMDFLKDHKKFTTIETTPQFLLMSAPDCYERLGSLAQMNPPIRGKRHQEAVWRALLSGVVDVIGTDHAPHLLEEKASAYPNTPSGMPGVQTVVPLMLDLVNQKKLSFERVIELLCRTPAKIYHMKSKGHIRLGFDADLTLVDMKKTRRIENSWIKSKCGWTPYDGVEVSAWPVATLVGGHLVMQNDEILGKPQGQLLDFGR
jgi:dihydroorotase